MKYLSPVAAFMFCWILTFEAAVYTASVYKSRVRRITNGEPTEIFKYPWQVQIFTYQTEIICGGVIISSEWILTAASCIKLKDIFSYTIFDGSTYIEKENLRDVSEFVIHENYSSSGNEYNDIALAKVKTEFKFDKYTQPAKLVESGAMLEDDATVTVTGWGKTINESQSKLLREASMFIVSNEKCKPILLDDKDPYEITDSQFCMQYLEQDENKRVSYGDGGDAIVDLKNVLIGIVSDIKKGVPEERIAQLPFVCTRLSSFREWVKRKTGV